MDQTVEPRASEPGTSAQADAMSLLRELSIIANEPMSVVTTLYMALEVIGRHTAWLAGRIAVRKGRPTDEDLEVVWFNRYLTAGNVCLVRWPNILEPPGEDSGRPIIIADLSAEGYKVEPDDCQSLLRGYASFPIYVANHRVGSVEFYSDERLSIAPELDQILNHAATLLGLVIERGQTQSSLRESERRFRAIFDQSYQLIGLLEPDGTLVEMNQTALDLAGIGSRDVIGKKLWETPWWAYSPEVQAKVRSHVSRAAQGETVHDIVKVQVKDGRLISIDFSIKAIRNLRGDVVLLIPEGHDITELRATLENLSLAETRLEDAQYVARMGHWEYDLSRQEAYWSDTLYPVFGLDPRTTTDPSEEFMARIHPDDVEQVKASLEQAYETRQAYEHTYRLIHPDGSVRFVFGAGNVVEDESGNVIKLTGIVQDVTRRRRLEASLARSVERLSRLNAMGQIVASSVDREHIFSQVMSAARALLNADLVALFLHEQGELKIQAKDQSDELNFHDWSIPTNSGIVGDAWTMGRPVWLSGEECLRRRSSQLVELSGYDPRSLMAVPVRWEEELLGVLEAADRRVDAFDEDDLEALQTVATWTAIALGKSRQHTALARRLRESEAIAEVSRALSQTLEPQSILELIADTAHRILPRTDWAVIHLLRGRPERLFPVAWAGSAPPAEDYIIAPNEGIAGRALSGGKALSTSDVEYDPRASQFARRTGMHSLLVAPIQSRNRMLGTISIVARAPNVFGHEDERLMTILAAQAAMAIENAQLFDSQRRARTVAEMQRERLRALTKRIVTAQEDERLRISRELHDEAGQALTSLKISLELIRAGLPKDQEALRQRLGDVAGLADETMETLRMLAHDLRPPGLDAFGLNVALEGLCYDFGVRTNLPVTYSGVELPKLPTTVALSMYRVVQEALTNIAKHAEARAVQVFLTFEEGSLDLAIVDDGKGFSVEADGVDPRERSGIGLVSMQERAELLGGKLEVDTAPGRGTRLKVRIPIDTDESADG